MSQAVIDFCEGLKTALLGIEAGLAKAKSGVAAGAVEAQRETKEHIDDAVEQLNAVKVQAEQMAKKWREGLPEQAEAVGEQAAKAAKEFGLQAQVALHHAAVLMAEAASKGAEGAAAALKAGAHRAHAYAEELRRDTAVVPTEPDNEAKSTDAPAQA